MPSPVDSSRAARLAASLRENLKRRKAQARSRRAGDADGRDGLGAAGPQQDAGKAAEGAAAVANPPESDEDGGSA